MPATSTQFILAALIIASGLSNHIAATLGDTAVSGTVKSRRAAHATDNEPGGNKDIWEITTNEEHDRLLRSSQGKGVAASKFPALSAISIPTNAPLPDIFSHRTVTRSDDNFSCDGAADYCTNGYKADDNGWCLKDPQGKQFYSIWYYEYGDCISNLDCTSYAATICLNQCGGLRCSMRGIIIPSSAPTPTVSATPSPLPSPSPTAAPTKTPSPSPSSLPSPSPSPTAAPTETPSPSPSSLPSPSPSPTAAPTETPSATPSPSPTPTSGSCKDDTDCTNQDSEQTNCWNGICTDWQSICPDVLQTPSQNMTATQMQENPGYDTLEVACEACFKRAQYGCTRCIGILKAVNVWGLTDGWYYLLYGFEGPGFWQNSYPVPGASCSSE